MAEWLPGLPGEPGFYWFQDKQGNFIVEVFTIIGESDLLVERLGCNKHMELKKMTHIKKYQKIIEPDLKGLS